MLAMRLTELRSEPKTPANMPLLRQLEFEFRSTKPLACGTAGRLAWQLINESQANACHIEPATVLLKKSARVVEVVRRETNRNRTSRRMEFPSQNRRRPR